MTSSPVRSEARHDELVGVLSSTPIRPLIRRRGRRRSDCPASSCSAAPRADSTKAPPPSWPSRATSHSHRPTTGCPAFRAVVSLAGSGYVTQGISQSVETGSFREIMTTPVACWTYQGHELPYLPNALTPRVEAALAAGEPVALGWAKPDLTVGADLVEAATIPVENIEGAVLTFHEVAARRLEAHKHPHTWEHVVHPGAGHNIIAPPNGKGPQPTTSPGPGGITFLNGGTPEIDLQARAETWRRSLEFLKQEL